MDATMERVKNKYGCCEIERVSGYLKTNRDKNFAEQMELA